MYFLRSHYRRQFENKSVCQSCANRQKYHYIVKHIRVLFEDSRPTYVFHSYGNITITGEGMKSLTYARHSCSLSSAGSLACHTSSDTGHPFIMTISVDPWQTYTPIADCLGVEMSLPVFTIKGCRGWDSNTLFKHNMKIADIWKNTYHWNLLVNIWNHKGKLKELFGKLRQNHCKNVRQL